MTILQRIRKDHLSPNEYSRPQRPLEEVKAIVLHWVANPGTSAQANRDFFELRKDGNHGYGSAHYIVDDHEIVEAIPIGEMAYHVGAHSYTEFARTCLSTYPNDCTIGIELCHPDNTGKFTKTVWNAGALLVAHLLQIFCLDEVQITTHHVITGKECPRWFVQNPAELERFRWDVLRLGRI